MVEGAEGDDETSDWVEIDGVGVLRDAATDETEMDTDAAEEAAEDSD